MTNYGLINIHNVTDALAENTFKVLLPSVSVSWITIQRLSQIGFLMFIITEQTIHILCLV